jgi:hypothetical protein
VLELLELVFDRAPVLELLALVFGRVPGLELPGQEFGRVPVPGLLALEFGPVAERALCRPLDRRVAAAAAIVSVVINLRWAAAAVRSAAEVEVSLARVAAEEARAWVAAASAVAVAGDVAVAVVAVAGDAGDEQFSNGTTTYEIEIQHHEAIKNFFGRLCDRLVRSGRVCVAGRAGKNQAGCDGRFSVQTKTIQHTERGDRQPHPGRGIIRCRSPNGDPRTRQQGYP